MAGSYLLLPAALQVGELVVEAAPHVRLLRAPPRRAVPLLALLHRRRRLRPPLELRGVVHAPRRLALLLLAHARPAVLARAPLGVVLPLLPLLLAPPVVRLEAPGASLSLSADTHQNVLDNRYDSMYL